MAPRPFVSPLARRLLGHPRGSALAVVAHVDRAWGYTYIWQGVGAQTYAFEDAFRNLFLGQPVGLALEPFRERYKELGVELAELGLTGDGAADRLGRKATAYLDARHLVILGDPAVRAVEA